MATILDNSYSSKGLFILKRALRLSVFLFPLFFIGCASVSVKAPKQIAKLPDRKPSRIYVEAFSTTNAEFNVDLSGVELEAFKNGTSQMLLYKLAARLPELAPTYDVRGPVPKQGWLVRGQFTRVNQGSRALRSFIGFGAGATKMETQVRIYDLSKSTKQPFLTFYTTGGSNAEPGAIGGAGPLNWMTGVGVLGGGVGNAVHGISEDAWRTAREIRNFLVEYCEQHRLL